MPNMLFVKDIPGGCRVECEDCGIESDSITWENGRRLPEKLHICPGCNKELFYPYGASW